MKFQRSVLRCLSALLACVLCNWFVAPMVHAQLIVAHRGASHDAPENTLSAFRLAFEQGADGIEGDFYVTSDQQIVCIHDKDTARTAGKRLSVSKSTLAQLRELEYGSWFNSRFMGEQIPTFLEVLEVVPKDKLFVIELKSGSEIVPLLKQQLTGSDGWKDRRLLIIAFDADVVIACKQQLPEVPVHWLTGFEKRNGAWTPSADTVIATAKRIDANGVGLQGKREVLTADFIAKLNDAGLNELHFWTIDAIEDARFFQQFKPLGLTTNRPGYLKDSLFGQ